jgi:hypothetical protein
MTPLHVTGICPACGSQFALRKDGTLRLHRLGKSACPGSQRTAGDCPVCGSADGAHSGICPLGGGGGGSMGLTVAQGLAQVMLLERIQDDAERRAEIRKVLEQVRSSGYAAGHSEGFEEGTDS